MRAIIAGFLLFMIMTVPCWAQDASTAGAQQGRMPGVAPPTSAEIELQRRMAKQRNQERFAQLRKDTDQLLVLATQLKKSVDEANDQTLSLQVIRKAEQIEKLARHVRQRMAGD